jgi:16S rRNA U516 pseudouridylate synthase RsuA-like enzyme
VAIGGLKLGDLPSGRWRPLTAAEVRSLEAAC